MMMMMMKRYNSFLNKFIHKQPKALVGKLFHLWAALYTSLRSLAGHIQQKTAAGLLQRPVRWLPCRSADAVAVCPKRSRSSCTQAARPSFSLSSHAQLVTLAELSTANHIQVVLAYLQVPARPGAHLPL